MNPANTRILVFAKAPLPGLCKTRLIPALGAAGAAELAERLLLDTLERISGARLAPIELWCWPDNAHPVFQSAADRFPLQLQTQQGADLGARMQHAAATALGHSEGALLVGCDCPELDANYLRQALLALAERPAVLGPADDGGYVLLGLRRDTFGALPLLFAPMAWGTDQVSAITRERLRGAGLAWTEFASLPDIDRPEDLPYLELAARAGS